LRSTTLYMEGSLSSGFASCSASPSSPLCSCSFAIFTILAYQVPAKCTIKTYYHWKSLTYRLGWKIKIEKKAPAIAGAFVVYNCLDGKRSGSLLYDYGSSPEAWISASSMAPGEHMMLMKVPPDSLATMGRCGQLIAMRKRANKA
jgi:hypothetical protein